MSSDYPSLHVLMRLVLVHSNTYVHTLKGEQILIPCAPQSADLLSHPGSDENERVYNVSTVYSALLSCKQY